MIPVQVAGELLRGVVFQGPFVVAIIFGTVYAGATMWGQKRVLNINEFLTMVVVWFAIYGVVALAEAIDMVI